MGRPQDRRAVSLVGYSTVAIVDDGGECRLVGIRRPHLVSVDGRLDKVGVIHRELLEQASSGGELTRFRDIVCSVKQDLERGKSLLPVDHVSAVDHPGTRWDLFKHYRS